MSGRTKFQGASRAHVRARRPPLITDDPDTPGPGYWEINLAGIVEPSLAVRRTDQPVADINYGVGTRIQLKFEMPWMRVRERGQAAVAFQR